MDCYAAEQQLRRLRQCVASSSSFYSATATVDALDGVACLYEHVESLLRPQSTQVEHGALAQAVEEELEKSIELLDACAATSDSLRGMRACVRDLELAVARRRRGDAGVDGKLRAYARLAKDARRGIKKQQQGHHHHHLSSKHEPDGHLLREVRGVAMVVLENVVAAPSRRLLGPSTATSTWSCVSSVFRRRARVASCEAAEADALASVLCSCKGLHDDETASGVQKELRALGDTIEGLEKALELVFRRLVQSRVFLLNMRSS